jgi:soluble lytic murein transglycosylase-like protein
MKRAILLIPIALATIASGSATAPVPPPVVVAEVPDTRAYDRAWSALVDKIADELHITSPELAETVTQAVEDASAEFDLNPWLLVSLIRIESYGIPTAVSNVGALGLTQIMPVTGKEIAGDLHIAEYDLFDPATNVRMGAYYLGQLLERFEGNERAALAAYNYGPTAVARMLRNGEPIPKVYAGKILRNLATI